MKYLKTAALLLMAVFLFFQFGCEKKGAQTSAPAENTQAAAPASGDGIHWMNYTDGMAQSAKTGKPVMIDFYTTWCKYCKLLESTTYQDPQVIKTLNDSFVAIKVNAEGDDQVMDNGKSITEKDLAGEYAVSGFPTIWFLDSKQQKIGNVPGYEPASDFEPKLTYIASGAYAKGIKFEDYMKSLGGK